MMINKVAKIIKDNGQQTTDDRFFLMMKEEAV